MKDKRLLSFLLVASAIFLSWLWVNNYLQRTHPEWYRDNPQQTASQNQSTQPSTQPSTQVAATQPAGIHAVGGASTKPVEIGSSTFDKDAKLSEYAIGLSIDPQGASISSATLNRLRAAVGKDEPYVYQKPYKDLDPASSHSLITQGINLNNQRIDLHNINWNVEKSDDKSIKCFVDIVQPDGKNIARITKTYTIRPAKDPSGKDDPSFGYELSMLYHYENQSAQPLVIKTFFNGPTVPTPENNRDVPEVVAGYNDQKQVALKHHPASSLDPEKDPWDILAQEKLPLLWTGWTSAYFDSIVKPRDEQQVIANAKAKALAKRSENGDDYTAISFETTDLTIPAGQSADLPFDVYLGPRQRSILTSTYYSDFPRAYDLTLVLTGGFCGFCTFAPLISVMVTLLGFFFRITHDWGLAIICLVILVRLILHPVTKRSQVSMSRLSKLAPEMQRLKDKYGDDKEALNKEMMSFTREHGMTQGIWGCLPMLLQMPIWIALWSSLQSTFELRHASFLWGFTWIKDLAQPDRLFHFPNNFHLYFFHIDAINILPICMAVVFFIQQKMTPRPPTMTQEQETQYKMMQWMSLLFPIFLYSGPSGLNLYILTSTSIGIIESKRIRDHIKEREEAEKAGKIIVDAKPTRASKKLDRAEAAPKKKGGFSGWLADLQKKADDLQREANRNKKKP